MRSVVKVGGSLLTNEERLGTLLAGLASGERGRCIVVPGGGPDADAVRASQRTEGFSDAVAHRRALDAMSRTAARFCDLDPRLSLSEAPWQDSSSDTALVWDPVALREGHPDIPETWDVTSDSLALWLAARIAAPSCTLVKSADAPMGLDAEGLSRIGLVDVAFPSFARCFTGAIVIEGPGGCVPVSRRRAA